MDFNGMSSKSSENQMEEKKKEKNQVVGFMEKYIWISINQGTKGSEFRETCLPIYVFSRDKV